MCIFFGFVVKNEFRRDANSPVAQLVRALH